MFLEYVKLGKSFISLLLAGAIISILLTSVKLQEQWFVIDSVNVTVNFSRTHVKLYQQWAAWQKNYAANNCILNFGYYTTKELLTAVCCNNPNISDNCQILNSSNSLLTHFRLNICYSFSRCNCQCISGTSQIITTNSSRYYIIV